MTDNPLVLTGIDQDAIVAECPVGSRYRHLVQQHDAAAIAEDRPEAREARSPPNAPDEALIRVMTFPWKAASGIGTQDPIESVLQDAGDGAVVFGRGDKEVDLIDQQRLEGLRAIWFPRVASSSWLKTGQR